MIAERPRWQRLVAVALGIAMSVLLAMEGVGRWAFNRNMSSLIEISGSNNADSYARQAERLFAQHKYPLAESFALVALDRSPVNQKALRTLGMARTAMGRSDSGRRAMDAAGRLGWQDIATQTWLMWDAQQRQRPQEALARADALARRGAMAQGLFRVLVAFGADPATLPPLVKRLELASGWRPEFFVLAEGATLAEAQTADLLLRRLQRTSAPPLREEVVPVVRRLFDLGAYQQAEALAANLLGTKRASGANLVEDGAFANLEIYAARDIHRTPFDWNFSAPPRGASVVELSDRPGDGALYVKTDGLRRWALATKVIRVGPGPRTLSFSVASDNADALERFGWTLTCLPGGQQLIPGGAPDVDIGKAPATVQRTFSVPASDCDFQILSLSSQTSSERDSVSATFDDVAIK